MPLTQFQSVKPRWWERLGVTPRHRYVLGYSAAYTGSPTETVPIKPEKLTRNIKTLAVAPVLLHGEDERSVETEVEIQIAIYGLTKLGALRRGVKEVEAVLAKAGIHTKPRIWKWELTPW